MRAACLDVGDVREAVSDGARQLQQAVSGVKPGEEEVQPGLWLHRGEEGQRGGAQRERGQRLRVRGAGVHHPQGGLLDPQQEGESFTSFHLTSHFIPNTFAP